MTIYDIAKKAGVSPSSVSRVINNKAGVNEESRKLVLEILKEQDFVPNAIARGLVKKSSKVVGILISDLRVSHHVDGVYYVQQELAKNGYCSLIINTGRDDSGMDMAIRELTHRMVDGVIMMGAVFQCDTIKAAVSQHLADVPIVIVNGQLDLPNTCGIIINEEAATMSCVDALVERGRRAIAFICDNGGNPSVEAKLRGFNKAAGRYALSFFAAPPAENSYEGGYRAAERLMDGHAEIDGILCSADILAAGAIRALKDLSVSVPEQVSVIGMNNSTYAELCYPTLSSLDTKRNEASVLAAKTLIKRMTGKETERIIELGTDIIFREST